MRPRKYVKKPIPVEAVRMTTRYIPKSAWTRKPKAKHFLIRDKAKADRLEKAWKAKSKRK